MAETIVKNEVCNACGKNARPGSLFCYNCGSSISAESASPEKVENDYKTEKLTDEKLTDIVFSEKKSVSDDQNIAEAANNKTVGEALVEENTKLKTAASMRRKPKSIQRKRIEVVWEEPESAPNVWFILVALLLTGFALGLWFLASYLK